MDIKEVLYNVHASNSMACGGQVRLHSTTNVL